MATLAGMSIRAEIDLRLKAAATEARNLAFEEAIAFLRLSGFETAAEALDLSAFGSQHVPKNDG